MTKALTSHWFLFCASVCVCFLYLVLRTPYSFFEPIFLAEDGGNYFTEIAFDGFFAAVIRTHQGYFVFGNLILSGLSFVMDRIFFSDDVRRIPLAMALVSGLYFATLASLPLLLLRRRLSKAWLGCLALLLIATPLGEGDSAIIGRISNVGFSFVYLAVILIIYRIEVRPSGVPLLLCDLCLFVCANTNPVVYLLVPLAALPYFDGWKDRKALLKDQAFLSFLVLLVCLAAAGAYLAAHRPPGIVNVLSGSFVWKNAIEMLLAREFLYPLVFPIYPHLRDSSVILLTALIVLGIVWVTRRQTWAQNKTYAVAIAGFVVFSVVGAIFRPGLSIWLRNYQVQPLHTYFYGMNLVATLLVVLVCHDFFDKVHPTSLAPLAMLVLYSPAILRGGGFGTPDAFPTGPPPFSQDLATAVATNRYEANDGTRTTTGIIIVSILPPYSSNGWWRAYVPREWAVRSVGQDSALLDEAKLFDLSIAKLRAGRGLSLISSTSSRRTIRVAQLGFLRPGCIWIRESAEEPDPRRTTPGPLAEFHYECKPGDVPVLGDWNGHGRTAVGTYQSGKWLVNLTAQGYAPTAARVFRLGKAEDIPVTGDWNGDGRTKIGTYKNGTWILDFDGSGLDNRLFLFGGQPGDIPVVGDWSGSGRDKIGVFRSGLLWVLDYEGNARREAVPTVGMVVFPFGGVAGDIPVVGDWNGDGRIKAGLLRRGQWILDTNGNRRQDDGDTIVNFAPGPGDKPAVSTGR